MEYRIYAVRDEAVQSFGVPFFVTTEAVALRNFKILCNDPNSTVYKSPSDFALYCLGSYNDEDASFSSILPALVLRASSCVKEPLNE